MPRQARGLRGLAAWFLRAHAALAMLVGMGRTPGRPDRPFNDFLHDLNVGGELANPLRTTITDKVLAKNHIGSRIGAGRTIPTLAVLDTPAAIAAFRPPFYPVAVKPTHSSGRLIRVGSDAEWQAAEGMITAWLKHDYFRLTLE